MRLKYVTKTPSGTYEYRRQVPARLRVAVGKREIKKVLGSTETEARAAYSKADADAEKILAKAKAPQAQQEMVRTALMDFHSAKRRVEELGINPSAPVYSDEGGYDAETMARDAHIESIARKYSLDAEGHPDVTSPIESMMIALLGAGPKVKAPEPTFDDAVRIYIQEKHLLEPAEKKQLLHVQLIAREFKAALNGKPPALPGLKREHGRAVRDFMLTEKERQPESVERYLNTVRAIINMAIKEFDLECGNPFMDLEVKKDPTATRKSKRLPLPTDVLRKVTKRIHGHAGEELQIIWDMLAGTGCRPSEVTGLRVEDVRVDATVPHIRIEWHDGRRVKDEITQRWVPLVGSALASARAALELSKTGRRHKQAAAHMLFPTYGRLGGAGAASAAIISKHLRLFTTNPKHVLYSLRHNAKDNLRLAGVPVEVQNMILGHTNGGVAEGYGGDEAILEVTSVAMAKAFR
ncbi:tyrosine-type recombinase/integrase [Rhizobium anhuiense]|uniref:site-specific integrase n=1 Tax=Rhizobium anhuiense TaxID=1184720 RepID=UPI0014421CD3|nr:site-specific integrase [Rhizobium anhuiense]NKM55854.1 tyrosine-type recombinase/integrase [Rhizobium anhuiense]